MRRSIALLILVFACAVLLHGQTGEKEGKAWLEANPQPPTMNVTGVWAGGSGGWFRSIKMWVDDGLLEQRMGGMLQAS